MTEARVAGHKRAVQRVFHERQHAGGSYGRRIVHRRVSGAATGRSDILARTAQRCLGRPIPGTRRVRSGDPDRVHGGAGDWKSVRDRKPRKAEGHRSAVSAGRPGAGPSRAISQWTCDLLVLREVRFGSNPVRFRTSKCFPLSLRWRQTSGHFRSAGSCQDRMRFETKGNCHAAS